MYQLGDRAINTTTSRCPGGLVGPQRGNGIEILAHGRS